MRVLVAGAGGALGFPLVRRLVADGHTVFGFTRSQNKAALLRAAGAEPFIGNALDFAAVSNAVRKAQPTHVVNLLTAIPARGALKARDLAATNTLRRQGSANVLRASVQIGVARVVAESFVAIYGLPPLPRMWKEGESLLSVAAADPLADVVLALRALEAQHTEAAAARTLETVVLRYGFFYGPGVPSTESLVDMLRHKRMFFPKNLQGKASWIHIDDAVSATMAALIHKSPAQVYNIADDTPMSVYESLVATADAYRVPHPRSMPAWMLRWAAPLPARMASAFLTMDNDRAKHDLQWRPAYSALWTPAAETRRAA